MSEVPTNKRVLVADADEIVAFIASHILSRYDFAVQTATHPDAVADCDGYAAVVASPEIAANLVQRIDASRLILLGDGTSGLKAFAHLRKPLELELLVSTVTACANRR